MTTSTAILTRTPSTLERETWLNMRETKVLLVWLMVNKKTRCWCSHSKVRLCHPQTKSLITTLFTNRSLASLSSPYIILGKSLVGRWRGICRTKLPSTGGWTLCLASKTMPKTLQRVSKWRTVCLYRVSAVWILHKSILKQLMLLSEILTLPRYLISLLPIEPLNNLWKLWDMDLLKVLINIKMLSKWELAWLRTPLRISSSLAQWGSKSK